MKFVKGINGNYVNLNHVSTLEISPAYNDGKPLADKYWVTAFIPFVNTDILFIGSKHECMEFIEELINND